MSKADDEQQARLDRAREIGLFRYMLVREAADPALSGRQRGQLVRALAAKPTPTRSGGWCGFPAGRLTAGSPSGAGVGSTPWCPVHGSRSRAPGRGAGAGVGAEDREPQPVGGADPPLLAAQLGWAPDERTLQRMFALACLLVGQPTLRRTMKLAVLAALQQRTALRYTMPGMTAAETTSYIKHHLGLAGRSDQLFTDDATALIHSTARGIPARSTTSPPSPGRHLRRQQVPRRRSRHPRRHHRDPRLTTGTMPTPRGTPPTRPRQDPPRRGLSTPPTSAPPVTHPSASSAPGNTR
jgi:hypothetical protein